MRDKYKRMGFIAVVLIVAIIIVSINAPASQIYAKETLPGVETIINNNGSNNPYIILEVVPNKSDASLGYLVGGEEPVWEGRALNDIPVKSHRIQKMNSFSVSACSCPAIFGSDSNLYPLDVNASGYAEPGDSSQSFDLRGSFVEDVNGDYVSNYNEAQYTLVSDNTISGNVYYEKYYEFYSQEDEGDRYRITLSSVNVTPDRSFVTTSGTSEFSVGVSYNTLNKYFLNEKWSGEGVAGVSDNSLLDANVGYDVFEEDFTGNYYEFWGTILNQEITLSDNSTQNISYINAHDGNFYVFDDDLDGISVNTADYGTIFLSDVADSNLENFRFLDLEENDTAGDFLVSSVTPISAADAVGFTASEEYRENANGFYVKDSDDFTEYVVYDSSMGNTVTRYKWKSDYAYSSSGTIYYQDGFTNHEWLKQNVFDLTLEECKDFVLDVKTITMDELNSYDLSKVGMIYFAGGTYSTDIDKAKVVEIKQLMENNNFPVIWNRSAYLNSSGGVKPNLEKMGIVFQQQKLLNATASDLDTKWNDAGYWSTLLSKVRQQDAVYGLNYVNESLYYYDDTDFNVTDGVGSVPFVYSDFITKFNAAKITYGFQVVADEIASENFFLSVAGKTERISADITKATAMRYILNYGNKRNLVKSKISVLEIEPCNSKKTSNPETYYTDAELKVVTTGVGTSETVNILQGHELLTKEKIAQKWAKQFNETGKLENITLTRTHTGEFVGKIEDLNETYDLIYMGLDTSTMNTQITGTWPNRTKTTNTVFNDAGLNNKIYFHVGDLINTSSDYFRGLLSPTNIQAESSLPDFNQYRMAGNDITLDKYNDLVEYMNAGYPIIFANGFYVNNGGGYSVNTTLIDSSSYMYKVAKYALDHQVAGNTMLGENVFTEAMLDADTTGNGALSKLAQHINLSKLSITATYLPEAYSLNGTTAQYLSKTDGKYVLRYDVALKNDAAVSLSDTKYDCKLYIDKSVDGRYAKDEEIGNLSIYELKNGIYTQVYQNTNGKYELTAGKFYKVIREVPTGYVGVLPWKLQFVQNDNDQIVGNELVRKSISSYTAVPIPTSTKKTIHVLNITNGFNTSTNFNLQSPTMQNLLGQVKDFNIIIDVISAQEYMNKVSDSSLRNNFSIRGYSDFLNNYQMLIIGFWDAISIESGTSLQDEAGIWAIRQYISEGRSVLFTHDCVTYNYCRSDKAYWFNLFIRDSVGMDRYGVMTKDWDGNLTNNDINKFSLIPTENKAAATINYTFLPTKYDTAWKPNSTVSYNTIQGYSDFLLLRNGYWKDNGYWKNSVQITNKYTFTSLPFPSYDNYDNHKVMVSKINQGQITEYPFKIPETFEVSNTHGQWLQLNLDTDSNDDYTNDDIVVWYTISNVLNGSTDVLDYYQSSLNNARNNYYIYNRGNVTYSGVGHSAVNNETEMKLFINTMVAAYNAGISPPSILYKENNSASAGTVDKVYMPYDSGTGTMSYLDSNADIYFDVVDTNIKYGTKSIRADYYVEVASTQSYDLTKDINGSIVYLKAITPSVSKVATGEVVPDIHVLDDGQRYGFSLSQAELSLLTKNSSYIWISTSVTYKRTGENGVEIVETSTPGYSKMEVVNLELFDLE